MELVPGGDLFQYISARGNLSEASTPPPSVTLRNIHCLTVETEAQYFAYQICDALVVSILPLSSLCL